MSSVNDQLKGLADDFAEKRISRRQLWKGAAALGLSGMWISALERGALAAPAPLRSGLKGSDQDKATTLVIAIAENVDTFDPGFTVGSKTAQTVIQNTFDQLTQYQVVDGTSPAGTAYKTVDTSQIIGMLAESWKYDGNNMVFTLRDGLTYSNGDPIDANTTLVGYTRIFESKAISSALLGMGGAVAGSSAFSAPDAKTFVIAMSTPNTLVALNNVMHNTSCLDPKEIDEHKTDSDPWALDYFKSNLGIGNGPYKLQSYKPDDSLVLVANDKYWGDQPAFTTVILKIVPDATQRVQLLTKGDVDSATKIPTKEYADLSTNANVKTLSLTSNLIEFIEMNTTIAPFDKKEVRQAVAYATPYDDIISQIYLGQAQPAKSLVPSGMPTSDFSTNQYSLDYDKAKALLATAGFPDGKGLPDITFTVSADDVQKQQVAILMQDSLKNIGMNIKIEQLAYAQYNELEQGSKLQMWTDEWISWVNDPFYHLTWLAASASPSNYPKFKNDEVDAIISQYTLSSDAAGREAGSKRVQAIMIDESPYVFLCQPNWIFYSAATLDNYVYYNDELPRYYHFTRTAS